MLTNNGPAMAASRLSAAYETMIIADLATVYKSFRAQNDAVQSVQNMPRCTPDAEAMLVGIQADIEENLVKIAECLQKRSPSSDEERHERFRALLSHAALVASDPAEVLALLCDDTASRKHVTDGGLE